MGSPTGNQPKHAFNGSTGSVEPNVAAFLAPNCVPGTVFYALIVNRILQMIVNHTHFYTTLQLLESRHHSWDVISIHELNLI